MMGLQVCRMALVIEFKLKASLRDTRSNNLRIECIYMVSKQFGRFNVLRVSLVR